MPDTKIGQGEVLKPDRARAARKWLIAIIVLGIFLSPVPITSAFIADCRREYVWVEYCLPDLDKDFWTLLIFGTVHSVPFIFYAVIIWSIVSDEELVFSETIYRVKGGLFGVVLMFFVSNGLIILAMRRTPYNGGWGFVILLFWPCVSIFGARMGCWIGGKYEQIRHTLGRWVYFLLLLPLLLIFTLLFLDKSLPIETRPSWELDQETVEADASDTRVCDMAIRHSDGEWEKDPDFEIWLDEARKRGLKLEDCRRLLELN